MIPTATVDLEEEKEEEGVLNIFFEDEETPFDSEHAPDLRGNIFTSNNNLTTEKKDIFMLTEQDIKKVASEVVRIMNEEKENEKKEETEETEKVDADEKETENDGADESEETNKEKEENNEDEDKDTDKDDKKDDKANNKKVKNSSASVNGKINCRTKQSNWRFE